MLARLRRAFKAGSPELPSSTSVDEYTAIPDSPLAGDDNHASSSASPPSHSSVTDTPETFAFLILGCAILLPWNVLVALLPHLASLLPSHPSLPSTLSLLATGTNFAALAWLTFLAPGKSSARDPSKTISGSLWALVGLLALGLLGLVFIGDGDLRGGEGWLIASVGVWTVAMMWAGSYLQAGTIAYSALLGPSETGATQSGQGMIAVLVSTVQIISSLLAAGRSSTPSQDASQANETLWPTVGFVCVGIFFLLYTTYIHRRLSLRSPTSSIMSPPPSLGLPAVTDDSAIKMRSDSRATLALLRRNWPVNSAVFLCYVITLAVFPAVTARVVSTHGKSDGDWWRQGVVWVPVGFWVFNAGDFLGRTSPTIFLVRSQASLVALSIARVLFVPFFLACNVSISSVVPISSYGSGPTFGDGAFLLGLLALGLSNGVTSANSMILSASPSLNPRITPAERDQAGTVAVFCLVGGLVVGSGVSFAVARAAGLGGGQ